MRCPPASERDFITLAYIWFFYGVKMMNERILDLLGEEKFQKIQNCSVLLIGLGGVGG